MTSAIIGGALLAGLVGAPHCLGMCGGLATAACDRPASTLSYHTGRLATYAALGAAAGGAGRALPGPAWVPIGVAAVFLVVFAAKLAGWSPPLPSRLAGLSRAVSAAGARALRIRGAWGRLLFGAVNGLLPCGLVWAALAMPVAAGGAAAGALAMLAFGLGTVPALAAATLGLRRAAARSPRARVALGLTVLALGLGSLAWRAPSLTAPSDVPACHTQP